MRGSVSNFRLSLAIIFATIGVLHNGFTEAATVAQYTLSVKFSGIIGFVPTGPDLTKDPTGVWALMLNATDESQCKQCEGAHLAAVRIHRQYLMPTGQASGADTYAIYRLDGEDIILGGNCKVEKFQFAHDDALPKMKAVDPKYADACTECTSIPATADKRRLAGRMLIKSGTVTFSDFTSDGGGPIEWCFEKPDPVTGKCGLAQQTLMAQEATLSLKCDADPFTVTLQDFGGSGKPTGLDLHPQGSGSSSIVEIEILNLMPADVLTPSSMHIPTSQINHFKWFYSLSKYQTPPAPPHNPHSMRQPESGGRPYCSFVQFNQIQQALP